jgi:hypothetical protein
MATCDPNFAQVSLLLTFDGTNGQTTFTDLSPAANVMTRSGTAQITTTNPKFGSGALTGTKITTPITASGALDLSGGGSWTIEGWIKTTGASEDPMSMGIFGTTNGLRFFVSGAGIVQANITCSLGGASLVSGSAIINDGNWHAFALVFNGTTFGLWSDGVSQGVTNISGLGTIIPFTNTVDIGGWQNGGSFSGQLDEIRVTKGLALYTPGLNYTPATIAFPTFSCTPTVPNVVGLTTAAATAILVAAGFIVTVVQSEHPTVPAGIVISQNPPAGLSFSLGSNHTITISTGPATTAGAGGDIWGAFGGSNISETTPDVLGKVLALAQQPINALNAPTNQSVSAAMSLGLSVTQATPAANVPTTPKLGPFGGAGGSAPGPAE